MNKQINFKPYPGSREAQNAGCLCPVLDNAHGRGYHCDNHEQFIIAGDCPVHGRLMEIKNLPEVEG